MKSLFTIALHLILWPLLVFAERLDYNKSFPENISVYLNNVFDEDSDEVEVELRIHSNSTPIHKWAESDANLTSAESGKDSVINFGSLGKKPSRAKRTRQPKSVFAPTADIHQLKTSAERMFAAKRNDLTAKVNSQKKIVDSFKRYNLLTFTQKFSTTSSSHQHLNGLNIIGIRPGINWFGNTSKDRILLIGAHYDTVESSSGVNDNGSGMMVLLETIRLINDNKCWNNYSIIFVAFDLEEYGALGSKFFVNNYLIPDYLIAKQMTFDGAIILDTLLNYNQTLGSQDIPYDIYKAIPEWSSQIRKKGFVGDFMAMMSRNNIDDKLKNQLKNYWHSSSNGTSYKLSELTTITLSSQMPDFATLANHANFLRSDHLMFWYHNNPHYNQTLKAVLLTDTGPFRGYMRKCYHNSCDDIKYLNEKNLKFLKLTAEVLARTAVNITNGKCDPNARP